MLSYRFLFICFVLLACTATTATSQDPAPPSALASSGDSAPPQAIALAVAKSTPLQVALDKEVRVKKVGQPVHGRLVQPVYAFDRLVVPAGTEVGGRISGIEAISGKKRVLGVLDGDFTPPRKVEVQFHDRVLPDRKQIPLQSSLTPPSSHPLHHPRTKSHNT